MSRQHISSGPGRVADDFEGLRTQADALLRQAADFLQQLGDDAYVRTCPGAMDSTIGKHVRHVLDHFAAPLTVLDGDCEVVNYDYRERNTPVETCRQTAIDAALLVRRKLRALAMNELSRGIKVRFMLAADGTSVDLPTTLAREVSFASHHALHHFATIKIIADAFGEQTPRQFGMAPSTLNHEEETTAASGTR